MKRAAQKKKKKNSRPQTYKVLDNFATLGNTSSYAATNATMGNTNGTLQTTLGTKPTVAKTYSALIVGTHFLSFEVDAGTCAPLALNTRHIVYEVLNATNAVVYSGTTAGSVSGVAVPIPTAGNYTLRYSLFKSSTEPLACQLMLDNIRWDRRVVADEFATALTGWTSSTANQLALLNQTQTLQIKNTQRATRAQLTLTANKNYNLSLTILKGTTCSASTVTVRIKNGTAIVAQTPITINASSAASIPVSFNFVSPVASPTLEIERTNFNTTSCSALQIDNVYITEKDWVNETFATIDNTSGYASSMPNALALTNTAQQLQLNYIAPSRGMGVSKKVTLDKDQKYTICYSFKNKMGISANNFVILELIKDGSIMYTRKLQATEATTFDYTAPATGEYTWRMRSSSIGTTTTQPITYSLDNLSIFYSYPYTVENCDNLADGYRFGFNTQEKDDEVYGAGNLNTAEFWEYDTRLGRRWNIDPVVKEYESPYACFSNNPIWFSDIEGDDTTISNNKKGNVLIWITGSGDEVDYKKESNQKNWDIIEAKNLKDASILLNNYKKENNLDINNVVIRHHGATNQLAPYHDGEMFHITNSDVDNLKSNGTTGNAIKDEYINSLKTISNISKNIFITACRAGEDVNFGKNLKSVLNANSSLLLNQNLTKYSVSTKYRLFGPHEMKKSTNFNECQTHGKSLGCSFVFYYKSVVKKFQKIHINSNGNPITGQKK